MNKTLTLILLLSLSFSVLGCSSNPKKTNSNLTKKAPVQDLTGLNPLYTLPKTLKRIPSHKEERPALIKALIKGLKIPKEYANNTLLYYNRVDLDPNLQEEYFVELLGRYTSGTGGNTGVWVGVKNGEYKILQIFTLMKMPLIISDHKTNGHRDLINASYGGGKHYLSYETLVFKNGKYTLDKSKEIKKLDDTIHGSAIFYNDVAADRENKDVLYLKL